jgi:hypothetical protein
MCFFISGSRSNFPYKPPGVRPIESHTQFLSLPLRPPTSKEADLRDYMSVRPLTKWLPSQGAAGCTMYVLRKTSANDATVNFTYYILPYLL